MNQFNSWYKLLPPAVRTLLTINVVLFALWIPLSQISAVNTLFHRHLTLQVADYQAFVQPWQFITYNFLHVKGGMLQELISLLVGMMFMVAVGRDYEQMHGSHRLFALYFIGGIGGGILAITLEGLFPGLLVARTGQQFVAGSMSAVLAIMMTVAILHPYKTISLLLFGQVKLLYIVIGYLIFDIFFFSNGAEVYAHWGGALFGFLFARAESSNIDLSSWALVFFPQSSSRSSSSSEESGSFLGQIESWLASKNRKDSPQKKASKPQQRTAKDRTWRRNEPEVDLVETSIEGEVDRILDKISAEGYESLTPEEKRILYKASKS